MSAHVKSLMRFGLPFLVLCVCALLFSRQVSADVVLHLPRHLGEITVLQWLVAVLCTLGSFAAVAQYDALAHRVLGTGLDPRAARMSGAAGIALGQTLGFGVLTSALVRWRLLPRLGFRAALRVSVFVSLSFVAAWAVVTASLCLLLPAPSWTIWPASAVMGAASLGAVGLFMRPTVRIGVWRLPLPSLPVSAAIIGWAMVDMMLAGAALFVLLPAGTLSPAVFLPLFLIALGSGLISNTPGGVGPFELVLLGAVPLSDPAPLLAAILAYRAIYYAGPALLAAVALLRPLDAPIVRRPRVQPCATAQGEARALCQNGGGVRVRQGVAHAIWQTGQTLTQFGDPVSGAPASALAALRRDAFAAGRVAMIYKCGARMAHDARRAGWRCLHIADDAVVGLPGFTLDTPTRRTLRRKLRAAHKAGVSLRVDPPADEMARIDAVWQRAHGRPKGGGIGRYCPDYMRTQWVGGACQDGHLIAFVTAHRAADMWCLDIMRHCDEVPDGTMHALVHAAICAARDAGARRFNLAGTIACPDPASPVWRWLTHRLAHHVRGGGLRQFKSSFAPVWTPRYAVARSWPALAFGLLDLARAIHHPPAILPQEDPAETNAPHDLDEYYEVASTHAA